jgi:hypothetical protein
MLIEEPGLSLRLAHLAAKYITAIRHIVGDPRGNDVEATEGDVDEALSFVRDLECAIRKREEHIGVVKASRMLELLAEFEKEAVSAAGQTFAEAFQGSVYSGAGGHGRLTGTTWGGDYKDEIKDGSCNWGYCTEGFPEAYDVSTLYDRDYSGHDWPNSEIIATINNDVHILNHLGHSAVHKVMKMDNEDVDALANEKHFFAYSQGCYAGSFDNRDAPFPYGSGQYLPDDCVAEHLVTSSAGAFAFIGNSRFGFGVKGSTNGPSQHYDRQFWDAIFGEHISNIGRANQDSKEDNVGYVDSGVMRFCYYEINLLGDPETPLIDLRTKQEHDVAVTDLSVPPKTKLGESVVVEARVRNIGSSWETNVEAQLVEDGTPVDTMMIEDLPSGGSLDVQFIWESEAEGAYLLGVHAVPVSGETAVDNNCIESLLKVGRVVLVDDDGVQCPESDYSDIQQAVDAAADGDLILVHAGTYRKAVIDKPVCLIGLGLPVIDGQGSGNVVEIQADNCRVEGFRIVGSGEDNNAGIWMQCSDTEVTANQICSNEGGIVLDAASD